MRPERPRSLPVGSESTLGSLPGQPGGFILLKSTRIRTSFRRRPETYASAFPYGESHVKAARDSGTTHPGVHPVVHGPRGGSGLTSTAYGRDPDPARRPKTSIWMSNLQVLK